MNIFRKKSFKNYLCTQNTVFQILFFKVKVKKKNYAYPFLFIIYFTYI